jgi:hypothetical protein
MFAARAISTSKAYLASLSGPAPYDPNDVFLFLQGERSPSTATGNAVFLDESPNSATATVVGFTAQGSKAPFEDMGSMYSVYSGPTTGNCIQFPSNTNYAVATTNDYTVEAYAFVNAWTGPSNNRFSIFQTDTNLSTSTGRMFFRLAPNGVFIGQTGQTAIQWAFTFSLKTWYHVAVIREGGQSKAFVNGVELTSFVSGNAGTLNNLGMSQAGASIGHGSNQGSASGYISNFRFVKGSAVYTTAFTPPETTLTPVAGTQLLVNFTNAGIIDTKQNANITLLGGAVSSTANKKYGDSSIFFDGVNDYVRIPASEISQSILSGDFTIDGWVYPTNLTGTRSMLISQFRQSVGANGFAIVAVNGVLRFVFGASALIAAAGTIVVNQWQHIAVTRSGNTFRVFIDGVQTASVENSITYPASTTNYTLGSYFTDGLTLPATGTTPFAGYQDEVRLANVCRWTSNFTPPEGPNM